MAFSNAPRTYSKYEELGMKMPGTVIDFTLSRLRWPLLFLYVNCLLCLGSLFLCFSPASKQIAKAFDVSIVDVNLSYMIGSIVGIPMTFMCMFLYRTFPSQWVLRVALCNAFLFGWFRVYSRSDHYWPIIVGNVVVSLSTPVLFTHMTTFCNRWFSDKERTLAIVICSLTIPGGNVVGFGLAGIVFRGIDSQTPP